MSAQVTTDHTMVVVLALQPSPKLKITSVPTAVTIAAAITWLYDAAGWPGMANADQFASVAVYLSYFLHDNFRSWCVFTKSRLFHHQDDRLRAVIYAVYNLYYQDPSLGIELLPSLSGKLISLCELREHYQVRVTPNPTFDFKYSRLVPPTELVRFKPP